MHKQVTFGHILTILAIIIIPLFVWGVNVERRFEQTIDNTTQSIENKDDISDLKDLIQENQLEVIRELGDIKLLIKNTQ